jgi:hypothetical protein
LRCDASMYIGEAASAGCEQRRPARRDGLVSPRCCTGPSPTGSYGCAPCARRTLSAMTSGRRSYTRAIRFLRLTVLARPLQDLYGFRIDHSAGHERVRRGVTPATRLVRKGLFNVSFSTLSCSYSPMARTYSRRYISTSWFTRVRAPFQKCRVPGNNRQEEQV